MTIEFFLEDGDELEVDYPNLRKFARAAREFAVYIACNASSLINYPERFRAGAAGSSRAYRRASAFCRRRFPSSAAAQAAVFVPGE